MSATNLDAVLTRAMEIAESYPSEMIVKEAQAELSALRDALAEARRPKTCSVMPVGQDEIYAEWYRCSLCGCENIISRFKFCPDCGARVSRDAEPAPATGGGEGG